MEVTLEDAYAEACRVIGEQIVQQRLLARATPPVGAGPGPQCIECNGYFPDHSDGCSKDK